MHEARSALYLMIARDGDDPKPLRRAAALWGRRLAWFLENEGLGAASYNPWAPEAGVR